MKLRQIRLDVLNLSLMNSIEIEDEDFFLNIGKIKFENNKLIEDIDEELDSSY